MHECYSTWHNTKLHHVCICHVSVPNISYIRNCHVLAMYMNHSHKFHKRDDYVSDNQIEECSARWCMVCMTLIEFKLWATLTNW